MKIPMIALATLTAGFMAAQAPPPQQPSTAQNGPSAHRRAGASRQGQMLQRMTAMLHLTPDQQGRAKAILRDSQEQAKALAAKVHEERGALAAAVKSDSEGQIDQITQQNARLNSQMEAIHLKAIAKVYSILTPDQKARLDARIDRLTGVRRASGV